MTSTNTAPANLRFKVTYLDENDQPLGSCEIEAFDYLEACRVAHTINPQAPEFEVREVVST